MCYLVVLAAWRRIQNGSRKSAVRISLVQAQRTQRAATMGRFLLTFYRESLNVRILALLLTTFLPSLECFAQSRLGIKRDEKGRVISATFSAESTATPLELGEKTLDTLAQFSRGPA